MVRRFEELKTGDTFAWQITTEEYPDFKNRVVRKLKLGDI